MNNSRRQFLQWSSASAVAFVAGQLLIGQNVNAQIARHLLSVGSTPEAFGLPNFEGVFIFDPSLVTAYAKDFGRNVNLTPKGVLQPKNSNDVKLLFEHAAKTKTPVAIRGTGGAAYGQTQIQDGYLIDTSTLNQLTWLSADTVKMGPGMIWRDVVSQTFQKGFVPPVLPDTIVTSVGGTTSAGGIGETSLRLGAMVDHVLALEVVLVDGTVLECNRNQHQELFQSILGGMGQFAAITNVTMKLMPAPPVVSSCDFEYSSAMTYREIMDDLEHLSAIPEVKALGGHFVRKAGTDEFTYLAHVSVFDSQLPSDIAKLKGKPTGPWRQTNYFDYANRNTKGWDAAGASGSLDFPKPYMSFYLPWSKTESFLIELKSHPDWALGAGRIFFSPLHKSVFGQSSFSLPSENRLAHMRLYKIVRTGTFGSDHLKILSLNEKEILPAVFKAGGTVYLPFSPLLAKPQEVLQFGITEWTSLEAIKAKYDSAGLLNPNAGLFRD